jgi:two-component system OmpR family sensor kinase
MRHLPIRLRLTLMYAVVMTLVLGAVGAYAYARLAQGFSADLNRELNQRAQDISGPLSQRGNTLRELAGRGFIEHGESFAELVTPTGAVIQATPTLRHRALLTPAQAQRAARSRILVDIPSAPGLNEPARLLATPFPRQGHPAVLVVGATRENGLEALAAIRARMMLAGPLLLLASALMAYLLAAAALRPVERMRRQAEQMTGSESGERLAVPDTRDEIARLGGTLNELLAKVEASVDRERRFVANASHELRTPLALLRTELDLATRRPRSHVELEATVHSVSAEVDRLVTLANDLLVLARESDAGLPVTRNEVSVPALFAHCTSRFLSDERRIRLVVEPGPVGSVYADEERLRQALDNLVENAFVHGGGTVKLTAVDRADLVEIHVTD